LKTLFFYIMAKLPNRPVWFTKDGQRRAASWTVEARDLVRDGWTQEVIDREPEVTVKDAIPEIVVEAGVDAYDVDSLKYGREEDLVDLEKLTKQELIDWALDQGEDIAPNLLKADILEICEGLAGVE